MSLRELYAKQIGVCAGLPLLGRPSSPHSRVKFTGDVYYYTIAIMAARFSGPEGGF